MVHSKYVLQCSVPEKKALQKRALQYKGILPTTVMEIERDLESEAERNHRQRLLSAHLTSALAQNGRMHRGQRGQRFAATRKFYRSRRK